MFLPVTQYFYNGIATLSEKSTFSRRCKSCTVYAAVHPPVPAFLFVTSRGWQQAATTAGLHTGAISEDHTAVKPHIEPAACSCVQLLVATVAVVCARVKEDPLLVLLWCCRNTIHIIFTIKTKWNYIYEILWYLTFLKGLFISAVHFYPSKIFCVSKEKHKRPTERGIHSSESALQRLRQKCPFI